MAIVYSDDQVTIYRNAKTYGTYAATVLHDENGNGVIDKNFLGMPREGAGASNNPKPRLGPPRYDEATFTLNEPTRTVAITVKYP